MRRVVRVVLEAPSPPRVVREAPLPLSLSRVGSQARARVLLSSHSIALYPVKLVHHQAPSDAFYTKQIMHPYKGASHFILEGGSSLKK